ncbi:hypothetical protein LTR47_011571 [Exophiala xenobiotica]|nr:hypothetical protein LTR41_011612 [Exophiala xenobiotica]KAK5219289.1 hypothetical protein LTR47_011571 [Exophiala xenobiotica]KAK5260392.1 hypothetical protein LTR40_004235 [Exophiala xenobiotica]KAK5332280.1 hypothetical protein LTR98_011586 [Exophiala xenobiotica]KAK5344605.1 hypothetical protein LTR61_011622 [Exophiala xenobiotica]
MSSSGGAHFLSSKSIVVSGAGIVGLTFSIALANHFSDIPKPKVIIFERDSYEARTGREGYPLSIRADNSPGGIQVPDLLGLIHRVRSVSVNPEATAETRGGFKLWDQNLQPIFSFPLQPPGHRLSGMRVRRNALQKVLADAAIAAGAEIHWETPITAAEQTEDGRMRITLHEGRTEICDLFIAADGSWSTIRSLLRQQSNLDYTGIVTWGGTPKYARKEDIPRPLDRDWGALLGGKGRQYDELIDESTKLAGNFAPVVKELVSATDPTTVMLFSARDRPPFAHIRLTNGPVIWIGDANHAVSPFAGNGANLAIMDGWDLAASLRKAEYLENAIAMYDKIAVPRAQKILTMSRWTIDILHATGLRLILYKIVIKIMSSITGSIPVSPASPPDNSSSSLSDSTATPPITVTSACLNMRDVELLSEWSSNASWTIADNVISPMCHFEYPHWLFRMAKPGRATRRNHFLRTPPMILPVRLWDARTGKCLQTLEGHSSWVNSVAFSPDGQQLASGSRDESVRLWDARTGESPVFTYSRAIAAWSP